MMKTSDIGLMINDPDFLEEKISVDTFLYRQGWHRNKPMAGKNFDNFEAKNKFQAKALSFCRDFAEGTTEHSSLLMFGSPGRGKTHLSRGIACQCAINGGRLIYWPLMQLIGKLKALMDNPMETPDQRVDWLANFPGLLIIDELGRSRGGNWDRDNVIYPLLDGRMDKKTIWISNFTPEELTDIYDEAIVSRLMSGHKIPFDKTLDDMRQS